MTKKTILELRNEIGVYNNILNLYIQTFDLDIFNEKYFYLPLTYGMTDNQDLRDYNECKDELFSLMLNQKEKIREFSVDYYRWKTPKYISEFTKIELSRVLDFLNENKAQILEAEGHMNNFLETDSEFIFHRYTNAHKLNNDQIVEETEIKKVSSYMVMEAIINPRKKLLMYRNPQKDNLIL